RIKFVPARLSAGQNPGGMELAPGATAGGFAALATHQVERARSQRALRGHGAKEPAPGAKIAPEFLAERGRIALHLCLYIMYYIQNTSEKTPPGAKSRVRGAEDQKSSFLRGFSDAFPTV